MLAALAHQLVQDVGDDQESYQQAFGTRSICLPAVTCRLRLPSICQQRQTSLCFLCSVNSTCIECAMSCG